MNKYEILAVLNDELRFEGGLTLSAAMRITDRIAALADDERDAAFARGRQSAIPTATAGYEGPVTPIGHIPFFLGDLNWSTEVDELIRSEKKIPAIKAVRNLNPNRSGGGTRPLGLKEAKDAVEARAKVLAQLFPM